MYRFTIIFLLFVIHSATGQVNYEEYFTTSRLRVDFSIWVIADTSEATLMELRREKSWAGSKNNLLDTFGYGEMRVKAYDSLSGNLIFTHGYSSLYNEWKTLPASRSKEDTFFESVLLPFPKNTIRVVIEERQKNEFEELMQCYVNPAYVEQTGELGAGIIESKVLLKSGESEKKIDLIIIGEGYNTNEREKFFNDAERFASSFSRWKPYKGMLDCFNLTAVFVKSGLGQQTSPKAEGNLSNYLNSDFNTLGMDRYLMTRDISTVRNFLSGHAYDQVCVLVNTKEYGGGGIYNYLTVFSSDHYHSEFLLQHEFGHAFASLADEYYTSDVSYDNIFTLDTEPYQPNITTLVDFGSKWKALVPDSIPVPTPNTRNYNNVIGVFEGAGYSASGIFRPYYNCTMKSSSATGFCPICKAAIQRMIEWHCE